MNTIPLFCRVEFDPTCFGGDYGTVGDFALIPVVVLMRLAWNRPLNAPPAMFPAASSTIQKTNCTRPMARFMAGLKKLLPPPHQFSPEGYDAYWNIFT